MVKRKRRISWLLALSMIITMFAGMPAKAAWDEESHSDSCAEEEMWLVHGYGLITTHWLPTDYNNETKREEVRLGDDDYLMDDDGIPVDYTDRTEASLRGRSLWLDYKEEANSERKHVTADELKVVFFTNDPYESASDYVNITKEVVSDMPVVTDSENYNAEVVDFFPTRGLGYYVLSYGAFTPEKLDQCLIIDVNYPDIGFYSTKSKDDLLLDAWSNVSVRNYPFYEGDAKEVYLYLNNRADRTIELGGGTVSNEDGEEEIDSYTFKLDTWNDEHIYMDENGDPKYLEVRDEDGPKYSEVTDEDDTPDYLTVTDLTGGWYKLEFADEMVTEAGGFDLEVCGTRTWVGNNSDPETVSAYFQAQYEQTGLLATWGPDFDDDTGEPILTKDGFPAFYNEDIEGWDAHGYTDHMDGDEIYLDGSQFWFDYKSRDGEVTHIETVDDLTVTYYADDDPRNAGAQPVGVGEDVAWLDPQEYEKCTLINFMPAKPGYYMISYKDHSDVKDSFVIYVNFYDVGLYKAKEKTAGNWISEEEVENYSLWKSDQEIASNTVYLNIGDRVLYDKDTLGTWHYEDEDDDTEHEHSAFELHLYGGEDQVLNLSYDKGGQPINATNEKYLTVTPKEDGWYELQFKTNDLTVGDGDDSWEPGWFDLGVITADAKAKNEGGEAQGDIWTYWMSGPYQSLGLAVKEYGSETAYTGDNALHIGNMISPNWNSLVFGNAQLNDGTVEFVELTKTQLESIKASRMKLKWTEKEDGWYDDGWTKAVKGEDFDYNVDPEFAPGEIELTFSYQNDYQISFGESKDYVIIHPYMDAVSFFSEPERPGDPDKIETRINVKKVQEGKPDTIYALMYVEGDPENPAWGYACDPTTMKFRTETTENDEPVEGFVEQGGEVKDKHGNLIGYEMEITSQANEDFYIYVTVDRNDPTTGEENAVLYVDVNSIEELKITTPPTKTAYTAGEKFDPTGMVVKAVYEDEEEETITDYTITPAGVLAATDKKVTITYLGKTVEQAITVKAAAGSGGTTTEAPNTEAPTTQAPAVPAKGTPIEDTKSDGSYTVSSSDSAEPTVEYKAPKNKNAKEVKIPDTIEKDGVTYKVTSIAPNAFKGNKTVTKVTIGNNVTTIGKNAFSGCTKLKTVTIGKNVTTIGASAFKGCSALTKVTIPAKTTKIGKDAFNGCKKLKTVTIGKNVTTIEANAFKGCSALTKVTIPAKTTKIGANAFSGCKNLKTITIKSTKLTSKSFAKNAFKGLSNKTVIKVPKKKKAAYAKLLKKAGFKGTVK